MQTWTASEVRNAVFFESYYATAHKWGRQGHPSEILRELWGERKRLTVLEIAELPIPLPDKIWLLMLRGSHVKEAAKSMLDRAIEGSVVATWDQQKIITHNRLGALAGKDYLRGLAIKNYQGICFPVDKSIGHCGTSIATLCVQIAVDAKIEQEEQLREILMSIRMKK